MAARPPTTPPTIGATGVEEEGGGGLAVAVESPEVTGLGGLLELELEEEEEEEKLDEEVLLDEVEVVLGVYQILSDPAATAQPSRV